MSKPELSATDKQRLNRRIQEILDQSRERDLKGQTLSLNIDARFKLVDESAVQFQLAAAILEETAGLKASEIVGELLAIGLATVMREGFEKTCPESPQIQEESNRRGPESHAKERPTNSRYAKVVN